MEIAKVTQPVLLVLAAVLLSSQTILAQNATVARNAKALSVFQVVRFPNVGCVGTSSQNGTCYTSSECSTNGGTSSGTCANGFGVCCIFTLGCGGVARQNCTYFQSTAGFKSGACSLSVCKCSSDICQLRVDFNTFVIAGPNTVTTTIGVMMFGEPTIVTGAGQVVTQQTQCSTDQFVMTGPAGSVPPVICGTNTGQHVYVDASDQCNTMTFNLGTQAIGIATLPTRSWNLKISQISCFDNSRLAPSGCTQYFTGTTGTIQTFNYGTGTGNLQLANQNQRICFRREKGYCRICFWEQATIDFLISATTISKNGFTMGSVCCNYGMSGVGTMGYDCVMIPGASTFTNKIPKGNAFCGGMLVTTGSQNTAASVCTTKTPFQLSFITDMFTNQMNNAMGFILRYQEMTTGC